MTFIPYPNDVPYMLAKVPLTKWVHLSKYMTKRLEAIKVEDALLNKEIASVELARREKRKEFSDKMINGSKREFETLAATNEHNSKMEVDANSMRSYLGKAGKTLEALHERCDVLEEARAQLETESAIIVVLIDYHTYHDYIVDENFHEMIKEETIEDVEARINAATRAADIKRGADKLPKGKTRRVSDSEKLEASAMEHILKLIGEDTITKHRKRKITKERTEVTQKRKDK